MQMRQANMFHKIFIEANLSRGEAILITQGFTNLEWDRTGTHNFCQTIAIVPGVQELNMVAFKSYAKVVGSESVMLIILGYSTCILRKEEQVIS